MIIIFCLSLLHFLQCLQFQLVHLIPCTLFYLIEFIIHELLLSTIICSYLFFCIRIITLNQIFIDILHKLVKTNLIIPRGRDSLSRLKVAIGLSIDNFHTKQFDNLSFCTLNSLILQWMISWQRECSCFELIIALPWDKLHLIPTSRVALYVYTTGISITLTHCIQQKYSSHESFSRLKQLTSFSLLFFPLSVNSKLTTDVRKIVSFRSQDQG